jgi:hypothetical protein
VACEPLSAAIVTRLCEKSDRVRGGRQRLQAWLQSVDAARTDIAVGALRDPERAAVYELLKRWSRRLVGTGVVAAECEGMLLDRLAGRLWGEVVHLVQSERPDGDNGANPPR